MGAYQIYDDQIVGMRRQGSTLREVGETIGVTRERVRQILQERYGGVEILLLPEERAAEVIGCSKERLEGLRKKGVTNPRHTNWFWLYDRDEIEKAMLLLQRFCVHCGAPIPMAANKRKYCPKCSRDSRRNYWPFRNEDSKRVAIAAHLSWRKRHPERYREIQRKAVSTFEEKRKREHYATTLYVVVSGKATLPLNSVVKAVGCENNHLILVDGSRIPIKHVRKLLRRQ